MPYPVIYKLLTDDGLMAFSAYPKDSKVKSYTPPEDIFSNITTDDMDAVMYTTQKAGKSSKKNKSKKNKSNNSKK